MPEESPLTGEVRVRWIIGPVSADFPHLALHVGKVAGLACSLAEKMEHGEDTAGLWADFDTARLPDLVILAAMLAEVRGVDLSAAVERRYASLREARSRAV